MKRVPDCGCELPLVFLDTVHQMQEIGAMATDGLFRVPGDHDDVLELRSRYEVDELWSTSVDVHGAEAVASRTSTYAAPDSFDVHVWASFFKAWLRSLKDPVIPENCYDDAIRIAEECGGADVDEAKIVGELGGLLDKTPHHHKLLTYQLCEFLQAVDPVATKMTPENLAIVFAPCLLRHPDLMVALTNSRKEIAFTRMLVEYGPRAAAAANFTGE